MALKLFAVAAHVPFLEAIAHGWLAGLPARPEGGSSAADPDRAAWPGAALDGRSLSEPVGDRQRRQHRLDGLDDPLGFSDGLILLPTRRAARALSETFLRLRDGRPVLLPRIAALGALDEAPLALAGALDLPPAVEPIQRLAALTLMILALPPEGGAPRTADRAWLLAQELAALMDEAERAGIDLARRLPDAADPAFAAHWARTLAFLHIVTGHWPAWLAENGLMNPAARQVALLEAQARAWEDSPPPHRVLIAGTSAGLPAVARLLRVVSRMPNGCVVLPHLDRDMGAAAWDALEPSHAQAGLARLLAGFGATRDDVRAWPDGAVRQVPESRFGVLSRALLPAVALHDWLDRTPAATDGLFRLAPADQGGEAQAIALVLRDALETPGARVALVTPDRDLAGQVATALLRFGVVADDSAGETLADTPPAAFLRLLAQAVAEDLAPVPLMALLKHPLAAAGMVPVACREAARLLERRCLRGPRPIGGIAGLRLAAAAAKDRRLDDFVTRLERCLEPALRFDSAMAMAPADAMKAVIEAAERLAATADAAGPARLWALEEGEALAERLAAVCDAVEILPDLQRGTLPGLLDAVLEGAVVRSRRALRGRGGTEHPRVFIWGLLEARLQSADVIVLGGLAESVWPPVTEPGPWLSRPMRAAVGLPAPEETVGLAAHDFLAACCSAATVVLSCPVRRDNAPAVPARWLTRLDMFLAGRSTVQSLPEHPAAAWARMLDLPAGPPAPVAPPRPRPAVHLRPRRLSVTAIETWLRDPYAIYAQHVLRLPALPPLDQATDAADYGSIVHAGLHRFLRQHDAVWPDDAPERLCRAMAQALAEAGLRPALQAWWAPRLERIARWVCAVEAGRRTALPWAAVRTEVSGGIELSRPGGSFRLHGRADRIERYPDGSLAILDYKTGRPPSQAEVEAGLAPQLLLEAAIAAEAGFGAELSGAAGQLVYWHLSGGIDCGKVVPLFEKAGLSIPDAVADARARLCALIDDFDRPERAYLARPHPGHAARFSDYEHLARVAEWSLAGDGDE